MPEEFPDFTPDEYFISREENKGHILYEELKEESENISVTEEKAEEVSENAENSEE